MSDWLTSSQRTIAIRVPHHEGFQKVLEQVGAVFTTSANITDEPLPQKVSDINPVILDQVQVACYDESQIYDGKPSTILDFSAGVVRIVRQGAVAIDSI